MTTTAQLPRALEAAIIELARTRYGLEWEKICKHLIDNDGFSAVTVNLKKQDITNLYLGAQAKYAQQKLVSPPHPPSPPQDIPLDSTTAPSLAYSTDSSLARKTDSSLSNQNDAQRQASRPTSVQVCIDGADRYDTMGCEFSETDPNNSITFDALQQRYMHNRVKKGKILLTWRENSTINKTRTTEFNVVDGTTIELSDIKFGTNWLRGPPRDGLHPSRGRKRRAGDNSDIQSPSQKRPQHTLSYQDQRFVEMAYHYIRLEATSSTILPPVGGVLTPGTCHETETDEHSESGQIADRPPTERQDWDSPG
ncbi:hypothetical protein BGZ60DRAFT_437808 [Tricladium varicosporioides]|nr:hypothetical protein BGZ60DRAFT_437808 [Hymenoscyphus varicosporioides]